MTADDKANGYHRCLFRRFFAGGREWGNCSFSYSSDTHVSLSKKIWWFDGLENARMTKVLRKGNRPNSGKMNLDEKRNGPEPRRRMSALTSVHFSARRQLQRWAHQEIPSQVKKTSTQSLKVIPTRADVKIMLSLICLFRLRSICLTDFAHLVVTTGPRRCFSFERWESQIVNLWRKQPLLSYLKMAARKLIPRKSRPISSSSCLMKNSICGKNYKLNLC